MWKKKTKKKRITIKINTNYEWRDKKRYISETKEGKQQYYYVEYMYANRAD